MPEPINLFFAYARADQALRDELDLHLAFLRRSNMIEGWYDGNISAGEDWQQAIDDHLHTADIILLLVSPNFIASDYCYDVEMKKAMDRHEAGEAVVIPVILRPCRWKYAPFGQLQALPKDAKPVSRWADSDDAFDNVAGTIDMVVQQLHARRNAPPPSPAPVEQTTTIDPPTQPTPITAPALSSPNFVQTGDNQAQIVIPRLNFELDLIRIPAGDFLMGSDPKKDKDAQENEQPQHRLHLPDYFIGKYPVTNAQFAAFVSATGHKAGSEWNDGKYPMGGDNHPANYVSWADGVAFCRWLSQASGRMVRLPTEAEWEKAARGTDGRLHPWGNEPPADALCNFGHKVGQTTPVGKYSPNGDSPYGCVDMSGNVWEWCSTLWQEKAYPFQVQDEWTEAYLKQEGARLVRGGSWLDDDWLVRCAFRDWSYPGFRYDDSGVRVAVSPS
ncbi:MAG: SUMF1/EgtB/PvdO family nonheme iron enzyme [Anaerolineales bacterium]|nr:SUMF1/EgtB/PvdO family nonheme iron enzyme [Anaerolineales bacterium]